jgi:hypothetical protein
MASKKPAETKFMWGLIHSPCFALYPSTVTELSHSLPSSSAITQSAAERAPGRPASRSVSTR